MMTVLILYVLFFGIVVTVGLISKKFPRERWLRKIAINLRIHLRHIKKLLEAKLKKIHTLK